MSHNPNTSYDDQFLPPDFDDDRSMAAVVTADPQIDLLSATGGAVGLADEGDRTVPRTYLLLIPVAAIWVAAVVAIAAIDGFQVPDSPPWPILLAALVPIAAFVVLLRASFGRRLIQHLDPSLLVAIQMWRVVGAAFLFGWANGELDAGFAIPAGIGDIATGITALAMLGPLQRHTLTRRRLIWFTTLGVGDFAIAVATGALIGPENLELLPWVLFPALAVPFFSIIHIINWLHLAPLTVQVK